MFSRGLEVAAYCAGGCRSGDDFGPCCLPDRVCLCGRRGTLAMSSQRDAAAGGGPQFSGPNLSDLAQRQSVAVATEICGSGRSASGQAIAVFVLPRVCRTNALLMFSRTRNTHVVSWIFAWNGGRILKKRYGRKTFLKQ